MKVIDFTQKEPKPHPVIFDRIDFIKSLNYYAAEKGPKESKQYALDYYKKHDIEFGKKVSSLPDEEFKNRGFVLRMATLGFKIEQGIISDIKTFLTGNLEQHVIRQAREKLIAKVAKPVPVKREVINTVIVNIDETIDSVLKLLPTKPVELGTNKQQLAEAHSYVKKLFDEVRDIDLMEYYRPKDIKPLKQLYTKLLNQIELANKTVKNVAQRVVKPKKINPVKMTAKVNYMVKYDELDIKSIPVSQIIGANKLYVYDVKNRKLILFTSDSGFMVSGTTLKNISITSMAKTIRKPEEFWKTAKENITMAGLKKSMDSINGKPNEVKTGRLNEQMILLKAG